MALDIGRKRVGIAVSDELGMIANPLETIPVHQLLDYLGKYVRSHEVGVIVIGEPRDMKNEASDATQYIEPVVTSIRRRFRDLSIERFDERFTSRIAFQAMIDSGIGKKKRADKSMVDKLSATLILQDYLESRSNRTA